MYRKVLAVLAISQLAGCTAYKHTEVQALSAQLDPSQGVLISIPEDGWFNNDQYRNSGRMTANAIRSAFSKYAVRAEIADDCKDEVCLDRADQEKYGYFVKPIILHWEDRATEWSGKPDRIEIQIVVFDTAAASEIANASYTGKSKWATLGGDHPQDLLPEPTDEFVARLYK